MIMTIRDSRTKKLYAREVVRDIPRDIQKTALRKLRLLNSARYLNDLRVPPTNKLSRLLGKREGQYNIRITEEWRLCFEWHQCHAYNVEVVHYQRDPRGK
jgi:proteic killer suppression protein